jgi:UDP-N-acetylglucosamine 4-epimerase
MSLTAKVLVTGGAGFIGSNLADELISQGAKVTILDNLITGFRVNLDEIY